MFSPLWILMEIGMNESGILTTIRNVLGRLPNVRLFRNNSGVFKDARGQFVRYGIPSTGGGSDLIGWTSIVIGPEHVGRHIAVLTCIEVKAAKGRTRENQAAFLSAVHLAGGFAGTARSVEDAERIVAGIQ